MPLAPVDPQVDFVALERRVLDRWRTLGLFEQVKRLREGSSRWVFYEGPPTANARPGLHHVWPRAFKDLFIRFQTMRGHDVPRKGGWDCHGLPVEIEVEKELGITRKQEIEAYGIDRFNERCRDSVHRYVEDFTSLTQRSAVWIDTKDAYWTLSNEYIESVWWLVRRLWDKGLLYEGHRVSPYCARCGTALSSHEVAQGYRDVVDPSVYVRFPVLVPDLPGREGRREDVGASPAGAPKWGDADLLVWTTTPWTLISNVAVAVGADVEYVRVRDGDGGRDLVMAAQLAPEGSEVVERLRGADLVGWRYRRPFDLVAVEGDAARVVAAGFVSTDEGTGLVHLAPAFGADDMEAAKAEGLPVLNPVGADGTFDERVGPWAGRFVKDADRDIIDDLSRRGLLVREQEYSHSYPHCWRCGTPLIYWAKTSWFARTSDRKADLLAQNERIGWHPDHIKHGRFGDWLENNVDWALSRDRYWGTPLPIWRCDDGHDTCVGSVAQLAELAGRDLTTLDLHRPAVDDVTFSCPERGCASTARRLLPVLDAWFDSGSMPSAQQHFLGESATPRDFPADFICEAIDQTRGWFYSLLAVNTLVFGETPYRNVVCLGHIVDEYGQKMSKSRGNVMDPWYIFEHFGSDALRWYFFSAGSPWSSRRVYEEGIREATAKTLVTLWNVFSFLTVYGNAEGWEPDGDPFPGHVLDRWALDQLDRTVAAVTDALEAFDVLEAATRLAAFVEDLSNWYVRRSRNRFWQPSETGAFATLHCCLTATAQLLAPFCPYLADEIYTVLTGEESVHLSDWPVASDVRDDALAADMAEARLLVSLGRAARTDARIGVRQPLRRALLLHERQLSDEVRRQIEAELNVKALEDVESLSDLMSWTVVPNFRLLGPRLQNRVNDVKQALAEADGSSLRQALEEHGWVEIAGERLSREEVEVRAGRHEEFALAQDGSCAVALDLELDDELRAEGFARTLVREINDLRKRLGLAISDRVRVRMAGGPRLELAMRAHRDWIASEVLAVELEIGDGGDHDVTVDGEPVSVSLAPAADT